MEDTATTEQGGASSQVSLGERILPFLFAVMETCWIDAIFVMFATIGLFQSHEPLMPLWMPFVMISGTCWLVGVLESRDLRTTQSKLAVAGEDASGEQDSSPPSGSIPGSWMLLVLAGAMALLASWISIYSAVAPLYDLRWLLSMVSDILLLQSNALHILTIVGLLIVFCWRGIGLSRRTIEPSMVFYWLRIGMGIILVMLIIQTGASNSVHLANAATLTLTSLLLIPIFLATTLIAHALAQAAFTRRSHPVGLQGSVQTQERSLMTILGVVGLLLIVVALVVGTFTSPAFLDQVKSTLSFLGILYEFVVTLIAYIMILIVSPIMWVLSLFKVKITIPQVRLNNPLQKQTEMHITERPDNPVIVGLLLILKIVLPILVIVFIIWLTRRLLQRRRKQRVEGTARGDTHESVWSWNLFWGQLRSFFLGLWRRLFPVQTVAEEQKQQGFEPIIGEPMARTIREIYRALLTWAASHGYPRKKDETPFEFQQRLDENLALTQPELGTITDAYTAIRYGEEVPFEEEVDSDQRDWAVLQQKAHS